MNNISKFWLTTKYLIISLGILLSVTCRSTILEPVTLENPVQLEIPIPRDGHVRILFFNSYHAVVRTLVDEHLPAGNYRFTWDLKDDEGNTVVEGYYFCYISLDDEVLFDELCLPLYNE
jgi:flagellar hook assembly protein FlgD